MFDFFIDTYKEYVRGEDVETEKQVKKEEAKALKIIYPKDIKVLTYVLGGLYIFSSAVSIGVTLKFSGINFSVLSTLFLVIIDICILFFLSRKTKRGEIIAIILSVLFAVLLYGSTMLNMVI